MTNSGYDETELVFWEHLQFKFDNKHLVEMYYLEKQKEDKKQFFNIYMQFCESTLEEAIQNEKVTSEVMRQSRQEFWKGLPTFTQKGFSIETSSPPIFL